MADRGSLRDRKAGLTLDLKSELGGQPTVTSVASQLVAAVAAAGSAANTPLDLAQSTEAQRQYVRGFYDALRLKQQTENFQFKEMVSPGILPTLLQQEMLTAMLTPPNQSDYSAIVNSFACATTPSLPLPQTNLSLLSALSQVMPTPTVSLPTTETTIAHTVLPTTVSTTSSLRDAKPLDLKPLTSSALSIPVSMGLPSMPSIQLQPQLVRPELAAAAAAATASAAATLASLSIPSTSSNSSISPRVKQELMAYDDSSDNASDRSRSASVSASCAGNEMSMDDQERKKLERKRARNRAAATKCRQKKMDRINELETQVSHEKQRASVLDQELEQLRSFVAQLQQAVTQHQSRGCPPFH